MSEDNQKPGGKKLAWGAKNIGAHFNPPRTAEQTRYLFRIGALGSAVRKVGHRTLVDDVDRLGEFDQLKEYTGPTTDDAAYAEELAKYVVPSVNAAEAERRCRLHHLARGRAPGGS